MNNYFRTKVLLRACSWLGVFSVVAMSANIQPALAVGTLTTARDYLTRQKASLTLGEKHQVFFTTVSAVSGGTNTNKVILQFPDADDGLWCRTAGTDLAVSALTDPSGATESATGLPTGAGLAGACTQGSGASSFDKITITNVNNLSATTKYGFSVTDGSTGKLGTAGAANNIKVIVTTNNGTTDIDAQTIAVSLVSDDQIAISALVDVTLSVSISSNAAAFGTLSSSTVSQSGVTTTVSTSAATGYISLASYNNTLTDATSDTIPDTAGGTIIAGESEYGASSSQSGNSIGIWSPTACANTASTSNATALSTTPKAYASSATAATNAATTLCLLTSASAAQAPGSYTSTVTLVTTARF